VPTTKKRRVFPFTAVIGQEEMKLALLLNVIDPRIGPIQGVQPNAKAIPTKNELNTLLFFSASNLFS